MTGQISNEPGLPLYFLNVCPSSKYVLVCLDDPVPKMLPEVQMKISIFMLKVD